LLWTFSSSLSLSFPCYHDKEYYGKANGVPRKPEGIEIDKKNERRKRGREKWRKEGKNEGRKENF
jgi:hypothetical protein